jgi:hypothetical protein
MVVPRDGIGVFRQNLMAGAGEGQKRDNPRVFQSTSSTLIECSSNPLGAGVVA